MEITATLENWSVQRLNEKEFIIWGEIYGDIKNRFSQGKLVHTSPILNQDIAEGCVVRTRNSIYKLGKMNGELNGTN